MTASLPSIVRRDSRRIALTYLVAAGAWIVSTDSLLAYALPPGPFHEFLQTSKGIAFVLVTSLILYVSVRRQLRQLLAVESVLRTTQSVGDAIFQSANDAILVLDESLRIHDANAKAEVYYGRSRVELRGLDLRSIRAPEAIGTIRSDMADVERDGSARWETIHRDRDGRTFPVDETTRILRWEGVQYSIHVIRDITEQRAAAERLRLQSELLRDMESIAKVGGWEFDVETGKGTWTDEVARIHELDPGAETNVERGLSYYSGDSRRRIEEALERVIGRGLPYDVELELVTPAGTRKWVHSIGRPVFRDGRVVQVRGSFQDVTTRVKFEKEIADTNDRLRLLARQLEYTREDERKHIAREIHDVLGQELTAIRMDLSMASAAQTVDEARAEVRRSISVVDRAIGTVRRLARELRPAVIDQLGFVEALRNLSTEFTEHSRLPCSISVDGDEPKLEDHVSISLYRVVQEALTNVARHAHASSVQVRVKSTATTIEITVDDDGQGLPAERDSSKVSFGLTGMRERVMAYGGTCEVVGRPEGGTRVAVHIDLAPSARPETPR